MSTILTKPKREARPARNWLSARPLEHLREEMQDLITRTLGSEIEGWPIAHISPSLDVSETNGEIEVCMDAPGMEAKDFEIQVNGNLLTISGERKEEHEEKGRTYHRIERRTGAFSRTVTLPCAVKEEAVDAQYKNGTLTIKLPKTEVAKSRKIAVKA